MAFLGLGKATQQTFRPKKAGGALRRRIDATLGTGNLREAVLLPPGERFEEWLAVNVVDFFNAINLIYSTLTEVCTCESCPSMNAGTKYEYRWADGVKVKKPIECSAPAYIAFLTEWIEEQVDDPKLFPHEPGVAFPQHFLEVVKLIMKRLFRVYAHIYHRHFSEVQALGLEAHINTCFKHFVYFTKHFHLVETKELAPLQELISTFE